MRRACRHLLKWMRNVTTSRHNRARSLRCYRGALASHTIVEVLQRVEARASNYAPTLRNRWQPPGHDRTGPSHYDATDERRTSRRESCGFSETLEKLRASDSRA